MLEGELEIAICRSYGSLLPALAAEGYELVACQPVLLGRRLDLLLRRRSDGRHCIIELKSGAPPMPNRSSTTPSVGGSATQMNHLRA